MNGNVALTSASPLRYLRNPPPPPFFFSSPQLIFCISYLICPSYQEAPRYKDTEVDIEVDRRETRDRTHEDRRTYDDRYDTQLDITEREYRRRTNPTYDIEYERRETRPREEVTVERTEEIREETPHHHRRDMGYYDDEGHYHSFRRGVERAADRLAHPFGGGHHRHHHHHDEVAYEDVERGPTRVREGQVESVRYVEPRGGVPPETITIPSHFIRIGDLLILQGRPCQVIRITTSAQTGQHRYLGVDLFTKQLHEESSFVSNPSSSVVVQTMIGPVFKQYRVLDMRDDGRVVAMTESGDVKQGLPVIDQGGLWSKIDRAFGDGRGSVRALVINDGGRELVVDYKVIHGSRL